MSPQLLFSVKDASVRYKETPVFQDLSLNIHQGKRIALIGKNGAGKSTLLKIIAGELEYNSGQISFEKKDFDIPVIFFNKNNIPFNRTL